MDHPSLEELLQFIDGELKPEPRARVSAHLESCAACRNSKAELVETSDAIGVPIIALQAEEQAHAKQLWARIEAKIRAAERGPAALEPAPSRRAPHWSRSLAYAAALLLLAGTGWLLLRSRVRTPEEARALPNPAMTPGAVRQVSLDEICAANDDEVVREVPATMEQVVFREYGLKRARQDDFEVDYLITPGLGGSDDVANLWPEPHGSRWNSYVKDQLEDRLHHMVCRGQLPLDAAQKEIASNWIAAYKKYFHTDEPLRASAPHNTADEPVQRLALLR